MEKSEDAFTVNFCGLICMDSTFHVFLPRNSLQKDGKIPDLGDAITLTSSLARYSVARENGRIAFDDTEGAVNLGKLLLARDLLDDYARHGIYIRRTVHHNVNGGRPDWNRTIKLQSPYPSAGGIPIYLDLNTTVRKTSHEHLVTLVHARVIRRLGPAFSWWVTGDADANIAAGLEEYADPEMPVESLVSFLKQELSSVYSEREIRLFSNLIHYLEDETESNDGGIVIGIRNFHHAWEEMLRQTIPHVVDLNSRLPKPAYLLKGSDSPQKTKGMITDIIVRRGNKLIVVDAKYYAATRLENAPGWGDMVKQFFYAVALKNLENVEDVGNYFAFPGESGPLLEGFVVHPETGVRMDGEFPPIKCIYLSPMAVLKHYSSHLKLDEDLIR